MPDLRPVREELPHGRVAVQLAKYLGAKKVIATGRNAQSLEEVRLLGADAVIPFALGGTRPDGAEEFESALRQEFAGGIDVVIDYLWGESAKTLLVAIAKTVEEKPVRFVQVGSAGGEETIALPAAVLRAAAIQLMGSGVGSVGGAVLLQGIRRVFEAVAPAGLKIATSVVPLDKVAETWEKAAGNPRVVFTVS